MSAFLQRYFSAVFYILGVTVLVFLVLLKRNVWPAQTDMILNSLDLPLLGAGMLYAGTSLYVSLTRNSKPSTVMALAISIPLILLFCVFAYLNFGLPFASA